MTRPVREKALKFGEDANLIGVLSEPPRGIEPLAEPAIILLNAGLLHRVGAARLYVRLARRLARMGFRVVRFDFSGIGDSDARRDSLSFEESAVEEIQEVMNLMDRTKQAGSFVLMGLCSGADMGFRTAGIDDRVVGVVQLDAYAYRTPGYYLHHYGKRALQAEVWKTFVATRMKQVLGKTPPQGSPSDNEELVVNPYAREFPPQAEVASALQQLVDRGVCMLNIFSGGQPFAYNHRGQYRRSFGTIDFGALLEVDYLGHADHIFSGLEHQEFVLERVATWMEQFGPGEALPQTA